MIIDINTTAVDVALNLSGSLAGFPVVLEQLPIGKRVGFDDLPEMWEDVSDVGQTYTPDIVGMDLELDVPVYVPIVITKTQPENGGPFSTSLYDLRPVVEYGNETLEHLMQ